MVESVTRELNANVSFMGLGLRQRTLLLPAMLAVVSNLDQIYKTDTNVPSTVVDVSASTQTMVSTKSVIEDGPNCLWVRRQIRLLWLESCDCLDKPESFDRV